MEEDRPEAVIEEEEEEEEVEDGPPPGFQCIINPQQPPPPPPPQADELEADGDVDVDVDVDEDEDEAEEVEEGPPPGFGAVVPNPPVVPSPIPSPDVAKSTEQDEEDDEDGPPPGWGLGNLADALPEPLSNEPDTSDVKMESNEDLDEGPPPGWGTSMPHQMPLPSTPLQPSSTVSSDIEMASNQTTRIDHETPPPVSQCTSTQRHTSPAESPVQKPPSSELPSDTGNTEGGKKIVDNRPTMVLQPCSPLQQLPPTPRPAAPAGAKTCSDKAQLVCGTCRKLCVYPRGTKWVQCPGCQEVNFVLEAHQVGQVNCGGCAVLLMYPHGAPAVQCSSCRTVTEIGAHNRRPPLSLQIQQAQRRHRSARAGR